MGACTSAGQLTEEEQEQYDSERKMTKLIEAAIHDARTDDAKVLKLLLLGTGESGKSTLFKQIIYLHGEKDAFSEEVRLPYTGIVYSNTLVGIHKLCTQATQMGDQLGLTIDESVLGSKNFILSEVRMDDDVNETIANHIHLLWQDPCIRATYDHRSAFQLNDSVRYFFDKIKEIGRPDYVPTYDDILQCRARTTGIVETEFTIDNNRFKMLDVGGQRNERKKWIHCFEQVTAVIFVAAINEYDQKLYEDGETNRVEEALNLFEEICNSRWFRDTAMILFLNKRDLFEDKFLNLRVPMERYLPDYKGGQDLDNAFAFLTDKFLAMNHFPQERQVYVHITCAIDKNNIEFTFNVVKDIIIKDRLKECGLLQ